MKRVLLIALLLAATDAVAVQYVPLSLGLIYQPTAPSLTPGDCVSGTSPMVVAVDTGAHYACVNSGSSDYYEQISSVATTALALAANGTNCSAGSFALGVDASGAAEGCTVAFTAAGVPAAETDAAHDDCTEIAGCVPGALTGTGTDGVLPVWDTGGLVDSRLSQTADAMHFQPSVTSAGHTADFDFSLLTNGRAYTFPDTAGTHILDTTISPFIPFESFVDTTHAGTMYFLPNDPYPFADAMTYRYFGGAIGNPWMDVVIDRSITYVEFKASQSTYGWGSNNGARSFKFSRDPGYTGATLLTDQGGIAAGGPVSTANGSTSGGSLKIFEDSDNGTNWFKITAESITSDATCAIGTDGLIPLACQTLQTTVSGLSGTATALAANGANCSSGSAPLGVDASGAAESCFAVQPSDADLTALAGVTSAADALPYFTGSGTATTATLTTQGRALIDDTTAAAQRTTIGTLYALQVGYSVGNFSLVDATTYYFGATPRNPSTSSQLSKLFIRRAGTIKGADVYLMAGTVGTNEQIDMYIRLNDTTDTLIASVSTTDAQRVFTNSSLSISVSAGDYIEIKMVCPTWATNPLTSAITGYLLIE